MSLKKPAGINFTLFTVVQKLRVIFVFHL